MVNNWKGWEVEIVNLITTAAAKETHYSHFYHFWQRLGLRRNGNKFIQRISKIKIFTVVPKLIENKRRHFNLKKKMF